MTRGFKTYIVGVLLMLSIAMSAQLPVGADSTSFVTVSMMVASPDYSMMQSSFGHGFLRMQCPSAGLDYCFSFESDEDKVGAFPIFTGDYDVRLARVGTDEYMEQFAAKGRTVTAYPLNLSLTEEQRLWQRLDEIHKIAIYPKHDYFRHGCSQELMNIVADCMEGRIVYDEAQIPYGSTIQVLGTNSLPDDSWIRLTAYFSSLDASDNHLLPSQRLFIPVTLPAYLMAADICRPQGGNEPLVDASSVETFFQDSAWENTHGWPVWLYLLIAIGVVSVISLAERLPRYPQRLRTATDHVFMLAYAAVTALLLTVFCSSTMPTTAGWSWSLLAFNPLLVLVGVYGLVRPFSNKAKVIMYTIFAIYLLAFMGVMACVGDHFNREQYLFLTIFACRWALQGVRR